MERIWLPAYDDGFDASAFLNSLGPYTEAVEADLVNIGRFGAEAFGCTMIGGRVWEYARPIGTQRNVTLHLVYLRGDGVYIVLHGFRSGVEGTTRADLRIALRRLEALESKR